MLSTFQWQKRRKEIGASRRAKEIDHVAYKLTATGERHKLHITTHVISKDLEERDFSLRAGETDRGRSAGMRFQSPHDGVGVCGAVKVTLVLKRR